MITTAEAEEERGGAGGGMSVAGALGNSAERPRRQESAFSPLLRQLQSELRSADTPGHALRQSPLHSTPFRPLPLSFYKTNLSSLLAVANAPEGSSIIIPHMLNAQMQAQSQNAPRRHRRVAAASIRNSA